MQNADSNAAWLDLRNLLEHCVRDERLHGFLRERRDAFEDMIRVHWEGDAAQYYRKVKVSKFSPVFPS
jgi:hypothetical protein